MRTQGHVLVAPRRRELMNAGYEDITVLDVSETALERARSRLGSLAGNVDWIREDITGWTPTRRWDLWHDRAVFHFLVRENDQRAYKAAALASLSEKGKDDPFNVRA